MRMQTVCGAPLTFTSSPLYPTSSLKYASNPNHLNLTKKTPPQFNQCKPFTVRGTKTPEDTQKQVVTSSLSRLISSQPTSHSPVVQPISHLSSPYVPCFTSSSSVSSISNDSDLITASSNSASQFTGTRIIPMFSRKRVPSHEEEQHTGYKKGHKTDLKGGSEPRAKTAFSGFLSIYHAAHTHKSPLSNSSNSLLAFHQAEMRKTVRNESGNKSTHSSRTLLENRNIHAEGRRGISDGASEDIGRSVSSPMCVTEDSPTTVFNGASFSRRDISSGHSLSLSSPVSRSLPQARPGLIITQAPKRRNIAASPTDNTNCKSFEDTAYAGNEICLSSNSNPANRSSLSVAENGRPGTSPCLLNEPRSTPFRVHSFMWNDFIIAR